MSTQPSIKYTVSPAARRQLNIAMSDLMAAKGSYEDEQLYYAALGKLTAQIAGVEPYESPIEGYKSIERVEEKETGEPTTVAYFFGNIRDLRKGKWVLNRALELDYLPLCMRIDKNDKNCKDVYWSVKSVTKQAAWKVFNEHSEIFSGIDFLSDRNAASRAAKVAAKPTVTRVKKVRAPKTVVQQTIEEMLNSQVTQEKPTDEIVSQTIEEKSEILDTQAVEENPIVTDTHTGEEKPNDTEEEIVFKDDSLEALLGNVTEIQDEQIIESKEVDAQSVEDLLGVSL